MAERLEFDLIFKDSFSRILGDAGKKVDGVNKSLKTTSQVSEKASNSMKNLGVALGGILTIGAGFSLGKNIVMTTARFQGLGNSIKFASDSATQGELSMNWIEGMSKKYGLSLEATAEGFKTFQGAMMKTKFSSNEVRKMFEQVSTGAVAMGLDAENTKGVMLALGQIMGKGKVQAEELRGQIGERIPGAFSIAARAMGMTTAQLDKFMSDGKLMSEDFLPKFAAEMEKTFGQGANDNMNSLTATITRMENAWAGLLLAIGNTDKDGLMGRAFNNIASGLDKIAEQFMTIDQLSKKRSNENTINILGNTEEHLKKQMELMKANKLSNKEIEESLRNDEAFAMANWGKNITDLENQLKSLKEANFKKEMSGFWGVDAATAKERSTTENMYENDKEFKRVYDQLTSMKTARGGLTGITDKLIDGLYKKETVNNSDDKSKSKKTTDSLKSEVDKIASRQPSNMYINIDAIIKGDVNNVISNANNPQQDLNNFLTNLENALLGVVNDVNYIVD